MSSGYLALNNRVAAPVVQRYVNATPTSTIGPALPGAQQENFGPAGNPNGARTNARVVQFKGDDDLFTLCGNQVFRYDGAAWNSVYTLGNYVDSSQLAASDNHGPHLVYVNGVPTLVIVWKHSTGFTQWNAAHTTDGTTWIGGPSGGSAIFFNTGGVSTLGVYRAHVVRNVVYFFVPVGTACQVGFYNPLSQTGGSLAFPISTLAEFCDATVWNGKHLILSYDVNAPFHPRIWELTGGVLLSLHSVTLSSNGNVLNAAKPCLFTDGTALFVIVRDQTTGWFCYKLTDNGVGGFTQLDITGSVFTAGHQAAGGTAQWSALIDHEANPTGVPDIWIMQSGDGGNGTSLNAYKWNGDSALIGNLGSANDSGGNAASCMPYMWNASGSHFWTSGTVHGIIESVTSVIGGETISFRLYSASGTQSVNVDLLYSDVIGTRANTVGTISDASNGTITGGNLNTGLIADNGTTLYSFKWNLVTDGVSNGDSVDRQIRVALP
jgi:hypothetical protein